MTSEWKAYDITIDGSALAFKNMDKWYEDTVDHVLFAIRSTASGRLICERIKKGSGAVTIYPRYDNNRNAESTSKRDQDGRGRMLDQGIIYYSPEWWPNVSVTVPDIPDNLRLFDPANSRDEILFHELVHAGRSIDRLDASDQPTSGDAQQYENEDDFVAILLTNIYMSEKGKKVFRGSHGTTRNRNDTHVILSKEQSTSDGFLDVAENALLVGKWYENDPIVKQFAGIDAKFNPVRAHEAALKNLTGG